MIESRQYRLANRMKWAGRVIGLITAVFFLTMLVGEAITEALTKGLQPATLEGILMVILGGVAVAGCIVSWWQEWLAGILLAVASIGFGIHIGVYAGQRHLLAWLVVGFPYLVASALILLSWQLSKHTS